MRDMRLGGHRTYHRWAAPVLTLTIAASLLILGSLLR